MPFTPPTAEQVAAHLQRFGPRAGARVMANLTLAMLVLAVVVSLWAPQLFLLPLLMLAGLLVAGRVRTGRMQQLELDTQRVQELAMLGRHIESLRAGWDLLPRVVSVPPLHGRIVATIGHSLDQRRAYDAAIIAYDYLIAHLPPNDPIAVQFQVQRSLAQLAMENLTDADDTLRRLRQVIEPFEGSIIGANHRFAQLVQQVRTQHYDQAIEESGDLIDALRPLGIEAGFGHAMIALAHHQLAKHHETPAPAAVGEWWRRATLLLAPDTLTRRYPELTPMAREMAP